MISVELEDKEFILSRIHTPTETSPWAFLTDLREQDKHEHYD